MSDAPMMVPSPEFQYGPVPRGRAPFHWKGYPGVSLAGVQRSPRVALETLLGAILVLLAMVAGVGLLSSEADVFNVNALVLGYIYCCAMLVARTSAPGPHAMIAVLFR